MDFDSTERLALKNYLEHYGVKGQKWGVRKFQDEKSSSRRTQSIRNVGTNIVKGTTSASAPKFNGRNSNRSNSLVSNLVASGVVANVARSSANGAKSASIIGAKPSGFKDVVNKSTELRNQLIANRKVEKANKYIKKLMANTADTLYDTPREKGQRMISEKLSTAANLGKLTEEEKAQAFVAEMADNMIKLLTIGDDDKVEDELDKLIKNAAKKFSPTHEEKKEKINEMLSKIPGKKK